MIVLKRYRFTIEYDGSRFFGWQRQSGVSTVQQTIEDQLVFFVKHAVTIHGAGRTDTGVHAKGQVAHADLQYPHSPYRLQVALNHFLAGNGVSIVDCEEVDQTFHAMAEAAEQLNGTYDFSSFRDSRCQSKTPVKALLEFSIKRDNDYIIARLKAPSFLHHQVRIMMGTLKAVGAGSKSLSDFISIRDAKDRTKAGVTAPPSGLTFTKVGYPT